MNCEKAIQDLVGRVAGSETTPRSNELEAHLSSCERCRDDAQVIERLWEKLGQLDAPEMSADAAQRTLDRLRSLPLVGQDQVVAASQPPFKYRALALAAMFIVALVTGAFVSRSSAALALFPLPEADITSAPPGAGGGLFLFLLHKPDGPIPGGRAVRYQQWADELRSVNQLVQSGALHGTDGWMLDRDDATINATPLSVSSGRVEGFFLISARDSAAVINAARISPHFDYGGLIEVRRIVE